MFKNRLLLADSYKHSHHLQLPKGTTHSFSYIESRGGVFDETLVFGLQAFLKEYLAAPVTLDEVLEAQAIVVAHGLPFNTEGWKHILLEHGGKLPLEIRAVPEGTLVPNKNVLLTITNTDPLVPWLPSFMETALLRAFWFPTQVATTSFRIKQIIKEFLEETGDVVGLPFKLHDFGARGVSSEESAALGGCAHLANFMGTDTMSALIAARRYYNEPMAGFSIPASEHSTMVVLGPNAGELKQFENMIDQFAGPGKIYACVSDGFDIYNAAKTQWGDKLKQKLIDAGGTLVIRPDSGDPLLVNIKLMEILLEKFGFTVNAKGFKVLNTVRLIQGDGVNENTVRSILTAFMARGWSADNIAFGMGGALLQNHTRDDNKWAMKCSAIKVNGEWIDVAKDPITDPGKKSKKGLLDLTYNQFNMQYKTERYFELTADSALRTVFLNGDILIDEDLATIRNRADNQ